MTMKIAARKAAAILAAAVVLFMLYFAIERPWLLRWGATGAEVIATLPGDEWVPRASEQSTRAITIQAPIDRVWPWLAQLGQDRAGFYSFEILEDLAGCEMPRETRLLPEDQDWKPGDALWMYPPDKLQGRGNAPLVALEPGRHLVFETRRIGAALHEPAHGTWGFYLHPLGAKATRLVVRSRSAGETSLIAMLLHRAVFEPMHYVMERKTMLEIGALAEGRPTSKIEEDTQVALWTLAFGWMVASLIQVMRSPNWGRALAIAIAAAFLFQALTLLQPTPILGSALIAALALGTWWRPAGGIRSGSRGHVQRDSKPCREAPREIPA